MESGWARLTKVLHDAADHWVTISAVGTSVLYLFGYLSLRFKLTALGVGTDLNFLDERYLFEGIRFLVYIVSIVPNLLLVGLALATPAWLASRFMPPAWRERAVSVAFKWLAWLQASRPSRLAMVGIVISLVVIQVFLRKAVTFSNLLVAERLAAESWLACMLVSGSGGWTYFYFHVLVIATIFTGILWQLAKASAVESPLAGCVLTFLLGTQILLLPINYGVLVSSAQAMPHIRRISDGSTIPEGVKAWLIWEGLAGITVLVNEHAPRSDRRALVTLPRDKATMIEIIGYDSPMQQLFGPSTGCAPLKSDRAGPAETPR